MSVGGQDTPEQAFIRKLLHRLEQLEQRSTALEDKVGALEAKTVSQVEVPPLQGNAHFVPRAVAASHQAARDATTVTRVTLQPAPVIASLPGPGATGTNARPLNAGRTAADVNPLPERKS
jgi:hypothetical protein